MNTSQHIAKHFRDVHFGGNWTVSNLRDNLKDVTWQEATTKIAGLNTIATLTYHVNYFVSVMLRVLAGGPLTGNDKYSFDHPPVQSEEDWQRMLDRIWDEAEQAAKLIEVLPESKLAEVFTDAKYGTYYRNLHGIIEHMHYHMGQIAIIKKLIRAQQNQ